MLGLRPRIPPETWADQMKVLCPVPLVRTVGLLGDGAMDDPTKRTFFGKDAVSQAGWTNTCAHEMRAVLGRPSACASICTEKGDERLLATPERHRLP